MAQQSAHFWHTVTKTWTSSMRAIIAMKYAYTLSATLKSASFSCRNLITSIWPLLAAACKTVSPCCQQKNQRYFCSKSEISGDV